MTGQLSFADIEAWALVNGFKRNGKDRLTAPCGDGRVALEFLNHNFRVVFESGETRHHVATVYPGRCYIDEHGQLRGAHLFTGFTMKFFETGDEDTLPAWIGEGAREALKKSLDRSPTP